MSTAEAKPQVVGRDQLALPRPLKLTTQKNAVTPGNSPRLRHLTRKAIRVPTGPWLGRTCATGRSQARAASVASTGWTAIAMKMPISPG